MNLYERAAFGDRPDLSVTAVPDAPRDRWLAAVVLGAQGHYARAATILAGLMHTETHTEVAALAAAALASHRRQLGGHAAARKLDAFALAHAGDDEARADALLGLAADAIGAGQLDLARRLRYRAPETHWRARVRAGWVAAEIDLCAGDAEAAVRHAEAARMAVRGSTRHRIKSEIVLGAALASGSPAMARKLVTRARDEATDLNLRSLVWPAASVLVQVDPSESTGHRARLAAVLHGVLRSADPRGRELADRSPWVPTSTGPTG